jgi:hypothetical protein
VAAIRPGLAALVLKASAKQMVIVQNDGSKRVAFPPPMPKLAVMPAPEAEPAIPSDAEAE